jgi:hypothetical protein
MAAGRHHEEDLAWLLSQASHQLTTRLCAVLEPEGLTLSQWWVLGLLADGTGHGMGEVADYAMLPPPTLTKAVDQLVAANLVYRRADRHDRRRVLVHLTARQAPARPAGGWAQPQRDRRPGPRRHRGRAADPAPAAAAPAMTLSNKDSRA